MQVVSPDEVVPDAVPISLMQRATVAPIGFWRNPPAVRCPVAMAVTAVAPVVTVFTSRVMIVRWAGDREVDVLRFPLLSQDRVACCPDDRDGDWSMQPAPVDWVPAVPPVAAPWLSAHAGLIRQKG